MAAGLVVSLVLPCLPAAAREAQAPSAAACVDAFNAAPARVRFAARRPPNEPAQMLAGRLGAAAPACALVLAVGPRSFVLLAGRWSRAGVRAWSTLRVPRGELAERLRPHDVETVLVDRRRKLRPPPSEPAAARPTTDECVREWNRRPLAERRELARLYPRGIKVTIGGVGTVRGGVRSTQPACRFVFTFRDGTYLVVLGAWGGARNVTAWRAPRATGATGTEIAAIVQGWTTNTTMRPDGTLRLFR